ncbi:MAG TPA: HTH domain-containing protein [Ignavibacteriales bacterium]|nr:HTH domain-containing protein [Ignavibacteriales bacterium]
MTFLELAQKVISETNLPMSANEIWEYAIQHKYNTLVGTNGKTPWASIAARIYIDLRDNPNSIFIKAAERPTRFFLKNMQIKPQEKLITKNDENDFHERELHKYLTYYLFNFHSIYTKTIFHEKSNKNKYAQWLHPDMVGVYFYFDKWQDELYQLSKDLNYPLVKIYSYELKRKLDFNNLREVYFQAVSNSSWANEGYIVAANIEKDEEFHEELKRLNNAFGIGVIELDIDDPDSTKIILPARQKDYLDLETVNKIAKINPDFSNFLKQVRNDISIREIRDEKYDKVKHFEELMK